MPRVSVIVPTFERAAFLREAVGSVIRQTFTDWECLVSDDGSGPEGAAALEEIGALDPRVRVLRGEHSGRLGLVRNRALIAARGEYAAFLDDDDLWEEDKLERQVRRLERETDVALLFSRARRFWDSRGAFPSRWLARRPRFRTLLRRNVIPCSTAILRREILDRTGLFDEQLLVAQDYDLWLRITSIAPIRYMPRVLCRYRVHSGAMTRLREEEARALEQIYGRFASGAGAA